MSVFFDLLLILTLALWLVRAGMLGSISIEGAALALVGLVVLLAIGRAMRMGVVRLVFRVGLPIAALATFVAWESQGDQNAMFGIVGATALLLIVLFSVYFIVRGVFGRNPRR